MNILIGVDDSPESRHAVGVAHQFFGTKSDYTIVSVGERSPLFAATFPTAAFANRGDLAILFDNAEREAAKAAVIADDAAVLLFSETVDTDVRLGHPGKALCDMAIEHDSDVVVIGSQDKNAWNRLFDPSVGRYLIDHASCPVLVIR